MYMYACACVCVVHSALSWWRRISYGASVFEKWESHSWDSIFLQQLSHNTTLSCITKANCIYFSVFFFLLKCYKLLPSINLIFLSSPSLLHTRITNALESSALEIWVQFCKDLCCCVAPELWSSPLQTSAVFSPNLLFVSSLHISDILSLGELISY